MSDLRITSDIIALDIGTKKTGVARIHPIAKLAEPLEPIRMDDEFSAHVARVLSDHHADALVVGLPRDMSGNETEQTAYTEGVISELRSVIKQPIYSIDEAATSIKAEELRQPEQSVDSVAAAIIATDFVAQVGRGEVRGVTI